MYSVLLMIPAAMGATSVVWLCLRTCFGPQRRTVPHHFVMVISWQAVWLTPGLCPGDPDQVKISPRLGLREVYTSASLAVCPLV